MRAEDRDNPNNSFENQALIHKDSLYQYALSKVKNESDAKDLVQETYLKAYKFFDTFEDGTNCKAWLFTILRNTFINFIRKDKMQPVLVFMQDIKAKGLEPAGGENPEDRILKDKFDDKVTGAINSLNEHYKNVVLLADVKGFRYKEIADIMNCPIGTVMSRLYRGRKLLREKLEDYALNNGYITQKSNS
ncbi:sigma-70 family RNA polymerase sigma factor [Candidatus Poribacteria bacterium]|nr:sigma-70 family RNA polymerase sigma factor [Candidatus Poribacteria bacterium]